MKHENSCQHLSVQELSARVNSGMDFLLLDCLPADHFEQQHLPGARNACVFEVNFLEQVAALAAGTESEIVIYGASEKTFDARTAAEKLTRGGYSNVATLDGGLAAWLKSGFSIEGDGGSEPVDTIPGRQPADGAYLVDIRESVIEWSGRNHNSTHRGIVRLSEGEIRVAADKVEGRFVIDMKTIENLNLAGDDLKPVLEAHLQSDDFFFAKLFPEAVFSMTAALTSDSYAVSSPNFEINGRLTLRGVTKELRFPATVVATEDGRIAAEAHFDLDRTRWGVIYGSTGFFEHLGMHLVYDAISLQVRIVA